MKEQPPILKILIYAAKDADCHHLQELLYKGKVSFLFMTATNQQDFFEKIKWITLDIILVDLNLTDHSMDDLFTFVENKFEFLPIILIKDTHSSVEEINSRLNGIHKAHRFINRTDLMYFNQKINKLIPNFRKIRLSNQLKYDKQYQQQLNTQKNKVKSL